VTNIITLFFSGIHMLFVKGGLSIPIYLKDALFTFDNSSVATFQKTFTDKNLSKKTETFASSVCTYLHDDNNNNTNNNNNNNNNK
jgi:hypothetical protein